MSVSMMLVHSNSGLCRCGRRQIYYMMKFLPLWKLKEVLFCDIDTSMLMEFSSVYNSGDH